jgi:tetratricopeptide (TPR) repeat protein
LELDPNLIIRFIPEMIKVTEGSPLYLEDLLRLCSILPPAEAIRSWRDKAGDQARQYALGRELDMLTKQAKEVLVASCVPGKPVSNVELEALTGLAEIDIVGALKALQRLFLVPKPTLHEGEQRFNVNINTRMLVKKVLGSSEMYRRLESAFSAISGEARTPTRKKEIASAIRKATFLVRSREAVQAETLLNTSLDKFPNDPDLLAFLGWVYKAFSPPRVTDARESFRRAWQLQCKNEGMYKHWSRMELDQGEWGKAAEAAEHGLKLAGDTRLLFFLAGYAHSRLGKELAAGLHRERAKSELTKAKAHLSKALKAPQSLESRERGLNADIYRAIVLTCEGLGDVASMREYFDCWRKEHPDDPDAQTEWARLSPRFALGM